MTVSIAHLGPPGTYTEQAALAYRASWFTKELRERSHLMPLSQHRPDSKGCRPRQSPAGCRAGGEFY